MKSGTTTRATDILRGEHDHILIMLDVLERMSGLLENGTAVDAADMADTVDFFRGFADACHHAKEEKLLFPELEAVGIPRRGGPVGVMLQEHEEGRDLLRRMMVAVDRYALGDRGTVRDFTAGARRYASLLRAHISKENGVLFQMADLNLADETQRTLVDAFEKTEREEIGEGVHERYHELLHTMRDRYLAAPG